MLNGGEQRIIFGSLRTALFFLELKTPNSKVHDLNTKNEVAKTETNIQIRIQLLNWTKLLITNYGHTTHESKLRESEEREQVE